MKNDKFTPEGSDILCLMIAAAAVYLIVVVFCYYAFGI